jgi:hypothetical protein
MLVHRQLHALCDEVTAEGGDGAWHVLGKETSAVSKVEVVFLVTIEWHGGDDRSECDWLDQTISADGCFGAHAFAKNIECRSILRRSEPGNFCPHGKIFRRAALCREKGLQPYQSFPRGMVIAFTRTAEEG